MIKLDKVSKKFGTGIFGLSDVSLNVDKGEFVFLETLSSFIIREPEFFLHPLTSLHAELFEWHPKL